MTVKLAKMKVFLLGRPSLNEEGIDGYLGEIGHTDWTTDAREPIEVLAEIAGRTCYDSFGNPRPGGNKAYMDRILEEKHGCYDSQTDVLTASGWIPWPEVRDDELFITLDPETMKVSKECAKSVIRNQHSGRMYRVESQQVDLLVTPDHRMLVCQTTTKEGRKRGTYGFLTAKEIGHTSHAYLKGGQEWEGCLDPGYAGLKVGRTLAAFLGFVIGDGSYQGGNIVHFHLRRERKIAWLKSIVSHLGWLIKESGDKFHVSFPSQLQPLVSDIYDQEREKKIPDGFLMANDSHTLLGLYEGLMQSDGHIGRTGDSFDTTSLRLSGQFQQLCLFIGLAANRIYSYGPEDRHGCFGTKTLHRTSVIRRCLRPEVNKWSGCDGKSFWVEDWCGDVYCADVGGKALYVRRNGIPAWCGNSVVEHGMFTFVATGVSRTLTHELVRHRLASYSQRSQRYVDESMAGMVCPEAIRDDEDLRPIWEESCRQSQEAYRRLAEMLTKKLLDAQVGLESQRPATEIRKDARGAARSVLPNCTETVIVFSANARALRHVLEMRGSRHAEREIRQLAFLCWSILRREAPNIFGDYVISQEPPGFVDELLTSKRKV